MGRTPCCDKTKVKRGPWSAEEDETLKNYLEKHGTGGNWISLPQKAGLKRCGKSCRLRWLNYLRPDIKHGAFTEEEDEIICTLYSKMGSRWSIIASQLPGRTDNDVKNHWNTKLKKKLIAATSNINDATAINKPLFDSSTNLLSLVSQTEAYNPTFSSALTSPKMPLLTDHDLTQKMFNTKNIAYEPIYFSLPSEGSALSTNANTLCNFSPISQEGSTISGSSSLAMEDNYMTPWSGNGGLNGGLELEGLRFDISNGYPYDLMGGIWSQEAAVEALPITSYANLDSSYYVDTKPQGMCPNVTSTNL